MNIAISDEARRVLRDAGWNEDQSVDVEPIKALLEQRGFVVPPFCEEVLRKFHGFKARLNRRGALSFLHFDLPETLGFIEDGDRPFLDALAQTPLCPVGFGGGALLFVTATGGMVVLSDQWLGFSRYPTLAEGMDTILGIRRTSNSDGFSLTRDQIPPGLR